MGWKFHAAGLLFLSAMFFPLAGVHFAYALPVILAGWVLILWREV
jgi:hypothetical protein